MSNTADFLIEISGSSKRRRRRRGGKTKSGNRESGKAKTNGQYEQDLLEGKAEA
jgi:hypothetical protein